MIGKASGYDNSHNKGFVLDTLVAREVMAETTANGVC